MLLVSKESLSGQRRGTFGSWGADGPRVDVCERREDLLAVLLLFLQEALQVQELLRQHVVFQVGEPALVQGVDLELQERFLLVRELGDPGVFVELHGGRGSGGRVFGGGGRGLGRAEE